jgi:hypothetical protein
VLNYVTSRPTTTGARIDFRFWNGIIPGSNERDSLDDPLRYLGLDELVHVVVSITSFFDDSVRAK